MAFQKHQVDTKRRADYECCHSSNVNRAARPTVVVTATMCECSSNMRSSVCGGTPSCNNFRAADRSGVRDVQIRVLSTVAAQLRWPAGLTTKSIMIRPSSSKTSGHFQEY